MADRSLRDQWKEAKAQAARAFDMKDVADKQRFGPKLDTYEAELKSYQKLWGKLSTNPDKAKEDAARKKVRDAAKAAVLAGQGYLRALQVIIKGSTGAIHKAADDLSDTLARDILDPLIDVATGKKRF
jgi:hypothetical protein